MKTGFVTIIGRPNVGKSTLLNALTDEKVAITSSRPQTTRNNIRAIRNDNESQIIFIDTPGIYDADNKLGRYMVKMAKGTFDSVDAVIYIVDSQTKNIIKKETEIIESLKRIKKPLIVVLNKIDKVETKEQILPLVALFDEKLSPNAIIPISALKKEGIELTIESIKKVLVEGPKYYPEDIYTDQPEKFIAAEIIREKLFRNLNKEIPYGIAVEVLSFKENEKKKLLSIRANIYCEKKSHKSIIIGKNGKMLKKVGSQARSEIEKIFAIKVYLELWVKVQKEWRNDDRFLNSMGYKQE